MTIKRNVRPAKVSAKRLAVLGGAPQYSTITKRGGKPKRKPMSRKEYARVYGSPGRVMWVKERPCIACGYQPSENHHTRTGGTSRKAGYATIVPLCVLCHEELHNNGRDTFEQKHDLRLIYEAEKVQSAWLASIPPLEASPK